MTSAQKNSTIATSYDAKGDLLAGTGADAFAKLTVGTNGQFLTADSTQSTGVKWSSPSWVGCAVSLSAAQTISNSTNTIVNWTAESLDTDNFHSTTTNNSRFTIPSGKAGKYLIQGSIQFNTNTTGLRAVFIYKNGSNTNFTAQVGASPAFTTIVNFNHIIDLAVSDYLEVNVQQSSGGNLDINGGSTTNSVCTLTYLGA